MESIAFVMPAMIRLAQRLQELVTQLFRNREGSGECLRNDALVAPTILAEQEAQLLGFDDAGTAGSMPACATSASAMSRVIHS